MYFSEYKDTTLFEKLLFYGLFQKVGNFSEGGNGAKTQALQTISFLLTKGVRAANETNRSRSSDRLQGW